MMDWSFVKSDLWFIQSFILSNTIEWHFQNTLLSNWMDMREGRFFNSNDSYRQNELYAKRIRLNWSQFIITHLLPSRLSSLSSSKLFFPITTLSNSFNPSITNRSTFSKQWPPISSLSIPFKQSVSNTLKLWAYPYSNRFVVLLSYSSSIFSRYSLFCRMNRSRESASQLLAIHQSYLSRPILSLHRMLYSSEFLLKWVMECLSQIRLSISTLQYHFAYIRIAIISFD